MTTSHARAVADIVEHYLDRLGKSRGPISTRQAVTAIRMIAPQCPLSDRELADLIATSAVQRGCSIAFDSDGDGLAPVPVS